MQNCMWIISETSAETRVELASNVQCADFSLSKQIHIQGLGAEGMSTAGRPTLAGMSMGYFFRWTISKSTSDIELGSVDG